MRTSFLPLLLVMPLVGCDDEEVVEQTESVAAQLAEVGEEPMEEPAPSADPAQVAPETAPKTPRSVDATLAPQAVAAISRGRSAARAEDWTAALAAFDEALEIVPGAPRIRCESGFIAYRAGDHNRAFRDLEMALAVLDRPANHTGDLREPLAMCLYNRALVHEEFEEPWAAVERLRASLALRPHPRVQARLERLEAAERDHVGLPAGASPDDFQRVLQEMFNDTCSGLAGESGLHAAEGDMPGARVRASRVEGTENVDGLYVFRVASDWCGFYFQRIVIAVRGADRWGVYELIHGASGSGRDGDAIFTVSVETSALGDHMYRLDLEASSSSIYADEDPGDDDGCIATRVTHDRIHTAVFCDSRSEGGVCGRMALGTEARAVQGECVASGSWDLTDAVGEGDIWDTPLVDARSVTFGDQSMQIGANAGAAVPEGAAPVGDYSVDRFFADVLQQVSER